MLTYKTHVAKETLPAVVGVETKFLRAAHENADPNDKYEHTHVLVELAKKPNIRNPRAFDIGDIHPNIQLIKTKVHWTNSLAYIAKEDPANADLKNAKESIANKVWGCETLQEALTRHCEYASEAAGIIALWNSKPRVTHEETEVTFRPWQQSVIDCLDRPPHPRKIHWYCDIRGSAGKSWLTKYLCRHRGAQAFTQFGGQKDTATIIKNALDAGWNGKIAIVDLPRQCEDKSIYEPLEAMKNGMITAIKYQGQTMDWDAGHIIVFANFPPKRGMWSEDRYDTHIIGAS